MPKIILPLNGIEESVTRPVMLEIARQLMQATGIAATTPIFYPGDLEKAQQPISNLGNPEGVNPTLHDERLSLVVDEVATEDELYRAVGFRAEEHYVYRDDKLDAFIRPIYSDSTVTMNFIYRTVDKNQAIRWRNDVRGRLGAMRNQFLHTVTYHYLLPEEFIVILKEVHRLREAVAPYGQSYDEYFRLHTTQRASLLTTQAGTEAQWGVAENEMRISGWFDFTLEPEKEAKEGEGAAWSVGFTYNFHYQKPIQALLAYPLVVHNQLLDEKYRPNEVAYNPDFHQRRYSQSGFNFGEFEQGRRLLGISSGYAIPPYDEFIPSCILPHTVRVVTGLTTVDPEAPTALLSLNDLGDLVLDPAVQLFLRDEAPYIHKPLLSVFSLSLYSGADMLPQTSIRMTSLLAVEATAPLDLRQQYHVRLGLVDNWSLLHPAALKRLQSHADVVHLLLDVLNPRIRAQGLLPPILGDNYITTENMRKVIDLLNRAVLATGDGQVRQFNTVQTLFVQSIRESTHATR